jgi:hypothetical protein
MIDLNIVHAWILTQSGGPQIEGAPFWEFRDFFCYDVWCEFVFVDQRVYDLKIFVVLNLFSRFIDKRINNRT